MAEDILVNGTTEILKKLGAIAAHEVGLMWSVKGELKKLQKTVDMIQKVLEDAEERQEKETAVRLWLQRLKQAAYDAEDIMDEVAYETLRRNMEIGKRFNNKVRNFFSLSNPLAFRLKIAHRVQGVNRILEEIANEKKVFNLKEGQASASNNHQTSLDRDTSPFLDDTEVSGRENEKSIIIKMLYDDSANCEEENFSVIPIVGFGGLGKTTLAQLVYKDEEVKKCFSLQKWICVANDSNDRTLLGEVFRGICGSQLGSSNKAQMQESIEEKLSRKKFLLVLDDVWNSDQWDDVKVLLKCGAQGSRVIVTTRIQTVANNMRTVPAPLHLGILSEAHCRLLFEKRAFRMGGPKKTHDLEAIGWEIVAKCGGVPLAVKALGSLMHSMKTINEWKVIQDSENLNVVGDNVMNVLRLSYDHLASPLKQCFQYCAIFPKDTKMLKDDLIQQWMAQGFIQSSDNLEMEEVGNNYFKTLCQNSFFQDIEVDEKHDIESCRMHDLVHDLAQSIMGKELLAFSRTTMIENTNIEEIRHLSMFDDDTRRNFVVPKILHQAKKLRTFFSNRNEAIDAWSKFKFIRVLRLEKIEEIPSSICELKLLRYLYIQSFEIKLLPRSVCQLYHLETLNCPYLEELPEDMWKLTKLRHLYIGESSKMPKDFGKLHHLRTISPCLCLGDEKDGRGIGELEHLNDLNGHLKICNMEKVRTAMHAQKAKLNVKQKIYHLELKWNGEGENTATNYSEVAEALEAPPNLRKLTVVGFPGVTLSLRTWLASGSLRYLVEIKLKNCRNVQEIPPIWHIQPSLEILEISEMDKVKLLGGKCTSTRAPAASRLRSLSLWQMAELEEWVENTSITPNPFPCLEELIVKNCGTLRIAPSHFPTLKKIILERVGIEGASSMLSQLSSMTSLECLEMSHCCDFTSIGNVLCLPLLKKLRAQDCPKLTVTIASFPSLKEIYLSKIKDVDIQCSSATNDRRHHLTSLTSLHVENVPGFTTVPTGFLQSCSSEHLQSVFIKYCKKFRGFVFADGDGNGKDQVLPLFSSNLKQIEIIHCDNVEAMDVRGLTSLENLKIFGCKQLQSLPLGWHSLRALKNVSLEYIPIYSFGHPRQMNLSGLTHLSIVGVNQFAALPEGFLQRCSKHLLRLWIKECPNFRGFIHDELRVLASLKELSIEGCPSLTSLDVRGLVSLQKLAIMDCTGIKSSPKGWQFLPPLHTLEIGGFSEELDHLPFTSIEQENDSPLCSSLKRITIWGWSKIKSLPHQLQYLTALESMKIKHFDALTALPDWLGCLSSLSKLKLHNCQSLMHLPSKQQMRALTRLKEMEINHCSHLSERLISDDQERRKFPSSYKIGHSKRRDWTVIFLDPAYTQRRGQLFQVLIGHRNLTLSRLRQSPSGQIITGVVSP